VKIKFEDILTMVAIIDAIHKQTAESPYRLQKTSTLNLIIVGNLFGKYNDSACSLETKTLKKRARS